MYLKGIQLSNKMGMENRGFKVMNACFWQLGQAGVIAASIHNCHLEYMEQ